MLPRAYAMAVGAHQLALLDLGKHALTPVTVTLGDAERFGARVDVIEVHAFGRKGVAAVDTRTGLQ